MFIFPRVLFKSFALMDVVKIIIYIIINILSAVVFVPVIFNKDIQPRIFKRYHLYLEISYIENFIFLIIGF